jgi:chromosome segregation ATPase
MKAIKFFAIVAALAILTTSCVERSEKYKTAIAQRDSLAIEKQALDSNYNQTIALLNDIEAGFSVINQNEKQIQLNLKGVESKNANQREVIVAQMKAIKETMEQNRAKIAELRNLESKKREANSLLTETIKLLQIKMDEQGVQIQSLRAELLQKNIVIEELTTTMNYQQNVMEQQKTTITEQVTDMNTVWYCVATSKKLKEAKIVTDGGLFKSRKVMETDFDKNAFIQADLRSTSLIATNSTSVKILSSHPQSSYTLVTGADKYITIKITDPSSFWSVSKYLVVQI